MEKKVIILPFDGYKDAASLLSALTGVFTESDIRKLVSHVKLNDGVHNPDAGGPSILESVAKRLDELNAGVEIFLDLKVTDVSATLVNILKKYNNNYCIPDILTVTSLCSVEGILKLRELLPHTKLAMVSVPTDISEDECLARFGQKPAVKIYNDLENIRRIYKEKTGQYENWSLSPEPFDLVVCSPHELGFLKKNLPDDYGFVVPGIRDEWMKKPDEHQKRTTGVLEALEKGATYVVMGAQLTKGNPIRNITPRDSQVLTAAEIAKFKGGLIVKDNPLETLKNCNGFYESPKDENGKYIGPVVAYAKKYPVEFGPEKNMVGFVYLNFAKAEELPEVRQYFASLIAAELGKHFVKPNVILGAPMGGLFLAADLGNILKMRTVFSEKVVKTAADPEHNIREKSDMVISRHDLLPGDEVILVEDVVNNFSTTEEVEKLIESRGAKLVAIACAFNRSKKMFWQDVPVITACDIDFDQYTQEDPEVSELIAEGNLILKPKLEWAKLAQAMFAEGNKK